MSTGLHHRARRPFRFASFFSTAGAHCFRASCVGRSNLGLRNRARAYSTFCLSSSPSSPLPLIVRCVRTSWLPIAASPFLYQLLEAANATLIRRVPRYGGGAQPLPAVQMLKFSFFFFFHPRHSRHRHCLSLPHPLASARERLGFDVARPLFLRT